MLTKSNFRQVKNKVLRWAALTIIAVAGALPSRSQDQHIYSEIGLSSNNISQSVPFWLRSNQFGSIPLKGFSGSVLGSFEKKYDSSTTPLFDWGGKLYVRTDFGEKARLNVIAGYLKAAFSIFELKVGRVDEITGITDTALSTGSFSVSGTALGIPKAEISIPDYFSPVPNGLFAFKGNFVYGWLGVLPTQFAHNIKYVATNFHQKSFYVRFGRPDWKIHLYGGFNHQVFWGNEKTVYGPGFTLNKWQTFKHVVFGQTWNGSKVGNHIGSIDVAADLTLGSMSVRVYRQTFYDEGALAHLANIADGLNGISIKTLDPRSDGVQLQQVMFEFFYSKNQAGYPWSVPTRSGDENYYNNFAYLQGWSYKGLPLGNPLVSPATLTRKGLPNDPVDYFNNNRVSAASFGAIVQLGSIVNLTTKLTVSKNYGTFGTSIYGHSTGPTFTPPRYGIFNPENQFSGYVNAKIQLTESLKAGCTIAGDYGSLLDKSIGVIFSISKSL